jgi:hypothetical protein
MGEPEPEAAPDERAAEPPRAEALLFPYLLVTRILLI